MAENIECSLCKNGMDSTKMKLCSECSAYLCLDCTTKHKKTMKSSYPDIDEKASKCAKHKIEKTLFCNEVNCEQAVCRSCAVSKHRGHTLSNMDEYAKQCLNDISKLKEENKKKITRVSQVISKLANKKIYFSNNFEDFEQFFNRRHEKVLNMVNEIFQEQIKELHTKRDEVLKEFTDEMENLEKLKTEIHRISWSNAHFPNNASDFKITSYFQKIETTSNIDIEEKTYMFELKTFAVSPSCISQVEMQKALGSIVGRVGLVVYNNFFTNKPGDCYAPSVAYDMDFDLVKDICYDTERRNLFVLTLRNQSYDVFVLTEKDFYRSFSLELPIISPDPVIALLVNHSILLLYENKLKLISRNMRQYLDLPVEFDEFENVSTICSSPCKNFTYVYCKSNVIFKVDLLNIKKEKKRFALRQEPNWMSVSENLDTIVFTGHFLSGIHVYSFSKGNVLFVMGNPLTVYRPAAFLSRDVIIAYNDLTHALEIFKCPEKASSRKINVLNVRGKKESFCRVTSIAKCFSNSVFICEKDRIYKLVF